MEVSKINCIYYNYRVARGWSYIFEIKKKVQIIFFMQNFKIQKIHMNPQL